MTRHAPPPKPERQTSRIPVSELFTAARSHVDILEALARRCEALGRSRISPEDFHSEKSEIVTGLRRLAGRMRGDAPRRQPSTTWRNPFPHA